MNSLTFFLKPILSLSLILVIACAPEQAELNPKKAWDILSSNEQKKIEAQGLNVMDMSVENTIETDQTLNVNFEALPNLSGKWALVHRVQTQTELPVLKNVTTTTITAYLLYDIQQTQDILKIDQKICRIEMSTNSNFGKTELPARFLDSLPPSQREGKISRQGQLLSLELTKHYDLRGLIEAYPIEKALPTIVEDANVIDQDQDQKPGMTVLLTGFPAGEVYIVQRTWDILKASLDEHSQEGEIEGQIEWGEEKNILDASEDILKVPSVQWIHPDPQRRKFKLYPLNNQATCIEAIQKQAAYEIDPNELPTMP